MAEIVPGHTGRGIVTAVTRPLRPPTAQEFVLSELRQAILSGRLAPGEPIRQDALAEQLGVSRVPLREALKILEGEGQVTYRPHRGYFVTDLSLDDLLEVYRIRQLLEGEAARRAIDRLTEEDLERLAEAQREVDKAGAASDIMAMTTANRRFHFILLEAAGMPRLMRLIRILWDATDTYRAVYLGDERNRQRVSREHDVIVSAVRSGDVELVVRVLDEHRNAAVEVLRQVVASGPAAKD
ncbi:MAG: FCD domain-containing protein [Streptosporangiales bacterium]|nr:FCD domain-containing protein [Streptosporangiales bacterium]